MSRRVADPAHPGITVPISSTDVYSVTTNTISRGTDRAHPPQQRPAPPPISPADSAFARRNSTGVSSAFSEIQLAPATRTSVVTTTTTTTVHFAPILIPRTKGVRPSYSSFSRNPRQRGSSVTPGPSSSGSKASFARFFEEEEERRSESALRLDPKLYPLSQAAWPGGLKKFKLALGAMDGVFFENGLDRILEQGSEPEPSIASGPSTTGAGKGKERATSLAGEGAVAESGGVLAAIANTASSGQIHQQTVPQTSTPHSRNERSAHAQRSQRRRSRRPRPVGSISGPTPGDLDDDSDIEIDTRNRNALDIDSGVDMDATGAAAARLPSPGPPRKRPRATSHTHDRSSSIESEVHVAAISAARDTSASFNTSVLAAATAASLPSPNMSPPSPVPTFVGGDESQECLDDDDCDESGLLGGESSDDIDALSNIDLGTGRSLSALLSLPDFVNTFDQLSPSLQSYFIFTLLKRSSIPVLQTINNIIAPSLRRDFLTDLPPELGVQILGYLDAKTLCRASVVCKGWRRLVDGEWRVWKERLVSDGLWVGDGSEEREAKEIVVGGTKENLFLKRWQAGVWDNASGASWNGKVDEDSMRIDGLDGPTIRRFSQPVKLASPSSSREASPFSHGGHFTHPFKTLYRRRFVSRQNWAEKEPTRVTFACHANNVVTCLQFDKDKIVSASDDHSINVFDTRTGATKARLSGHEGGVWALQYIGNILVSGSTDRTVRIWDLEKGKCTHVFVGHTSTVRCLQIVEPENVNPDPHGEPIWEPPYPLIVTGSRDWSLRVWKLPSPEKDSEYHPTIPMSPTDDSNPEPTDNPFHLRLLSGHRHAVRALAAHGRTLVSGSYDCHVRVWDMVTGECKHRLTGHTQKVYSVVFDHIRKQCASGSMDGTVRLWSTETGECKATLEGHSSLVGLLGLSYRNLVSAAADSTLRIWDPVTGECRHTLAAHSGAITCFQHDEAKVISGSDGTLKMWDVQNGTFTRDLLTGLTGVWQVSFDQRFCVAAVQRNGQSEFEILDFGPVDGEVDAEEMEEDVMEDEEEVGIKSEEDDDNILPSSRPILRQAAFDASGGGVTPIAEDVPVPSTSNAATRGSGGSQQLTRRVVRRAASLRNLHTQNSLTTPSRSGGNGQARDDDGEEDEAVGEEEEDERAEVGEEVQGGSDDGEAPTQAQQQDEFDDAVEGTSEDLGADVAISRMDVEETSSSARGVVEEARLPGEQEGNEGLWS
ncbi:WD40 repeat-like protein [Meredithblackwellia eburnea MCA 4105]